MYYYLSYKQDMIDLKHEMILYLVIFYINYNRCYHPTNEQFDILQSSVISECVFTLNHVSSRATISKMQTIFTV